MNRDKILEVDIEKMRAFRSRNCDHCAYSHNPKEPTSLLKMLQNVDRGKECSLKYALHLSPNRGLQQDIAEEIGFVGGQLPKYCNMFVYRLEVTPRLKPWDHIKSLLNFLPWR